MNLAPGPVLPRPLSVSLLQNSCSFVFLLRLYFLQGVCVKIYTNKRVPLQTFVYLPRRTKNSISKSSCFFDIRTRFFGLRGGIKSRPAPFDTSSYEVHTGSVYYLVFPEGSPTSVTRDSWRDVGPPYPGPSVQTWTPAQGLVSTNLGVTRQQDSNWLV